MSKGRREFHPDKVVTIEPCHSCGQTMRFELGMGLTGNHVINCPNCGHEHCRVIKDGMVTGDRWDSRNYKDAATYYPTVSIMASTAATTVTIFYNLWSAATAY